MNKKTLGLKLSINEQDWELETFWSPQFWTGGRTVRLQQAKVMLGHATGRQVCEVTQEGRGGTWVVALGSLQITR